MKTIHITNELNQHEIHLNLPEEKGNYPLVYLLGNQRHSVETIQKLLSDIPLILCFIYVSNWHDDMTPWPETSLFSNQPDFGGKADEFILELDEIIKWVQQECRHNEVTIKSQHVVGFSLSGLFALYLVSKKPMFNSIVAVSPSAWYEGIIRYFKEVELPESLKAIYLSLGEDESDSKNERISTVLDRTEELRVLFRNQDKLVHCSLSPGNHFDQMHERMGEGIKWVIEVIDSLYENH